MKRFLLRGLLYLSPLLIVIITIIVVDPYYLFTDDKNFDATKFKIGYSFDQGRRYKINTYMNNPQDKIILGASEINVISERNIPEVGWHSLSYGGAPLQESLGMYWEVDKVHDIREILIAPEFIKFYNAVSSDNGDPYYTNFRWESSQSAKALDIYNNKLDYFIDKYTIKSTWNYLIGKIIDKQLDGMPEGSKETFWKSQLDYADKVYNHNKVIDEKIPEIYNLFSSIKEDSDMKARMIKIVIPIQHTDLLKYEFGDEVYPYYKNYLKTLVDIFGSIYYFAYTKDISDKEEFFSDPFHYLNGDLYIEGLFGDSANYVINAENFEEKLENIRKEILCYE